MNLLTLGELLSDIKDIALPTNVAQIVPNKLVLDSRDISTGDVFVALVGTQIDGRKFIQRAIEQGAVAVLCHAENYKGVKIQRGIAIIEIPNLLKRLSELSARFYGYPANNLTTFGVTGTNGKTTCAQLYAQAKTLLGKPCGLLGTTGAGIYGTELTATGFTTPDAISAQRLISEINDEVTCLSIEVSSHSLDQYRVDSINFTSAAFTNLTRDHLDYHGSMEAYGDSKRRLFSRDELKHAVINIDDEFGASLCKHWNYPAGLIRYSLLNADAEIFVDNLEFSIDGISADIQTPWGNGAIATQLVGQFNLSNLLAVVGVLLAEGIEFEQVIALAPKLVPVEGRMQIINVDNRIVTAVVDYAHTPDGLEKSLCALKNHCKGKLISVFGCGGNRDRGKRSLMAKVAENYSDLIFVTNDNPRLEDPEVIVNDILNGFQNRDSVSVELDRTQAIGKAISVGERDDIVLIAGKGHEDYQILGNKTIRHLDAEVAEHYLHQKAASLCH